MKAESLKKSRSRHVVYTLLESTTRVLLFRPCRQRQSKDKRGRRSQIEYRTWRVRAQLPAAPAGATTCQPCRGTARHAGTVLLAAATTGPPQATAARRRLMAPTRHDQASHRSTQDTRPRATQRPARQRPRHRMEVLRTARPPRRQVALCMVPLHQRRTRNSSTRRMRSMALLRRRRHTPRPWGSTTPLARTAPRQRTPTELCLHQHPRLGMDLVPRARQRLVRRH